MDKTLQQIIGYGGVILFTYLFFSTHELWGILSFIALAFARGATHNTWFSLDFLSNSNGHGGGGGAGGGDGGC